MHVGDLTKFPATTLNKQLIYGQLWKVLWLDIPSQDDISIQAPHELHAMSCNHILQTKMSYMLLDSGF